MSPTDTNDYSSIAMSLGAASTRQVLPVSVVIPFYRGLPMLERTLAGLCGQTYPRELMEVLIVEDGGEHSEEVVEQYRSSLAIKLLRQRRAGFRAATCRNLGIRAASGDIIVSLDFDMILRPSAVAAHLRWFHAADGVATVGLRRFVDATDLDPDDIIRTFQVAEVLPDIVSVSNTSRSAHDKRLPELSSLRSHPFPENCFHGCNVAYRKTDALAAGLWNEAFNGAYGYEDIEFGYRLRKAGCFIVFEPDAVALHQENTEVTSEDRRRGLEVNRRKLYARVPGLREFREGRGGGPQAGGPSAATL
jgi:chondroitin synthase